MLSFWPGSHMPNWLTQILEKKKFNFLFGHCKPAYQIIISIIMDSVNKCP